MKILPRVEVNIKENTDSQVYRAFQDWLSISNIKEIDIKPNIIEFDCIPGYKFHGLKLVSLEDLNEHSYTFNFECDYWEDNFK
jgi:hypothetical protein